MSKGRNHHTARTTKNVIIPLDYDKFAESIVIAEEKAQRKRDEISIQKPSDGKYYGLRCIKAILTNKYYTGMTAAGVMASIVEKLFKTVAVLIIVCCIVIFVEYVKAVKAAFAVSGFFNLFRYACFAILPLLGFFIALAFWAIGNEMAREKDRNYIISCFAALSAFAALVVSISSFLRH